LRYWLRRVLAAGLVAFWNIQDLPLLMESLVQLSMMGWSTDWKMEREMLLARLSCSRRSSWAFASASPMRISWFCCRTVHCADRF
jgi:hypothetical protein